MAHGRWMEIESQLGHGTTVRPFFPIFKGNNGLEKFEKTQLELIQENES